MKTVLAIGAHPDDIEIGCGGTLSVLKKQGARVVYVVVTSGEEGSLKGTKKQLAERRESEARKSAKIIGAADVHFLREPDGLTGFSKETKIRLIALLRDVRPAVVFTHASCDRAPDHQVVHQLTKAAVFAASGPWFPDAKGKPHAVESLYGYEVWNPLTDHQMVVDISATMKTKIKALQVHYSQVQDVDYVAAVEGLAQYRGAMTMSGSHAEVFEVLKVPSLALG